MNLFKSPIAIATAIALSVSTFVQAAPSEQFDVNLDSDRDGVADHIEIMYGFDPLKPYDVWRDLDQDHLPKIFEAMAHKDPQAKDNDVFNQLKLLGISAIADLHSRLPSDEELEQALVYSPTPVDLYYNLLDADKLTNMAFIGQAYQTILGRDPDRDGARYYYHQLNGKMTKAQVIGQMLGSKEYDKYHQSLNDDEFINWLLQDLPVYKTTQAKNQYQQALANNILTREQLILTHVQSQAKAAPEKAYVFNAATAVKVLSLLITDALPDQKHFEYFISAIEHQDIELVLQQLLLSDQFREHRLAGALPSEGDIDGDGRPNGVEFILGFDPHKKDNLVLDNDEAFIRQIFLDGFNQVLSKEQLKGQLAQLQKSGDKAIWLTELVKSHVSPSEQSQWLNKTLLAYKGAYQGKMPSLNDKGQMTSTIEGILQSNQYQARFY